MDLVLWPDMLCAVLLQSACGKVPSSYELVGQRKGFKRYKSPILVQLLADYTAAQEAREAALSAILQVLRHSCCLLGCLLQGWMTESSPMGSCALCVLAPVTPESDGETVNQPP